MNSIRVLDCTLRDGGCVNDFNFGINSMQIIKKGLENSGVDIIECGYIDETKGSISGRTQFINDAAIEQGLLNNKVPGISYVAMIDYGKYNCNNLQPRSGTTIDGIRLAFHKNNRFDILDMCKKILDKGYKLFIQPMAMLQYSDNELLKLINLVNKELPTTEAFYIVDSFGEMRMDDVSRLLYIIDHNLNEDIGLGFHSHNNLQLSYANAIQILGYQTTRNKIIDASIMGMGKGAGNCNTELLLEHINHYYLKEYKIQPLLDVIDKVINQIYSQHRWGYAVEYYLSAMNKCTPNYAKFFFEKHLMSIDQIAELLQLISDEKKISFDEEYANKVFYTYNNIQINDDENYKKLQNQICHKSVLLIAPGRSVLEYKEKIYGLMNMNNMFTIMINMLDEFEADYIYINKSWIYEKAKTQSRQVIILSNMDKNIEGNSIILDYKKWTDNSEIMVESSLQTILNILAHLEVDIVYLAGFDGFEIDIDKNYYRDELKRSQTRGKIDEMNKKTETILKYYGKYFNFNFVTPSRYENLFK